MKKIVTLFISALFATAAVAQPQVRYIKTPRFARPLVERWIAEYNNSHSDVKFQIAQGQTEAALSIVWDSSDAQKETAKVVYIGETAVLPITTKSSEAAKLLGGKRLNENKLRELYFENDEFDDEEERNQTFEKINIYSGTSSASVAESFARHLGKSSSLLRGKRIAGDDLFLNKAIEKDPLGVTFNTLSNIYDLESRHVKNGLAILSLSVKKDVAATLSEGTLDNVLTVLETTSLPEVVTERVGLSYDRNDDNALQFISWVLENGTQYNHAYGLLNLDNEVAEAELSKVSNLLTAQR